MDRCCIVGDSENITRIEYSPRTKVMEITFVLGGIYEYTNVSAPIFGALVAAESVGKQFHNLITNNASIKYKKIG